jgi:hypothetical protein
VGFFKGCFAPGIPVHWIVGVLLEVGAFFGDQVIRQMVSRFSFLAVARVISLSLDGPVEEPVQYQ